MTVSATPQLAYRAFVDRIPSRRERHLIRNADGVFPRSLCRDSAWNVKAQDDEAARWCGDCAEIAARELAAQLDVLGWGVAVRVILGQLDEDGWDARKALIDRALEDDPERPRWAEEIARLERALEQCEESPYG